MKIKTRLLLALSPLPIFLLILIIYGVIQTNYLQNMSDSVQTNYHSSILAGEIRTDVKNQGIHLRNLLIYTDEQAIQEEIELIESESQLITQKINQLDVNMTSLEQKELVLHLKDANNNFNDYKENIVQLISENRRDEAVQLIDESSVSLQNSLFDAVTNITVNIDDNLGLSLNNLIGDFETQLIVGTTILAIVLGIIMTILFSSIWSLSKRLNKMSTIMKNVANGKLDLSTKVHAPSNDEIDDVAKSFNRMAESLDEQINKEKELTWIKTNIADITTSLSGAHDLETLGRTFLSKVVPLIESSYAVFYVKENNDEGHLSSFKLVSSYAFKERKNIHNRIQPGEGLVGQAVLEKSPIILTNVPDDYVSISSGLGEAKPLSLYILPISFEGEVKAVIEMASFNTFDVVQQQFLEELMADLGIILDSVMGRIQLSKLLEESQTLMEEVQAQSEELQNQQEELRTTNEELEEQTYALRQSEEKLQKQQQELEQTNIELEEKARSLEEQNQMFERANKEIEKARLELEEKANQLALSSKYKSEFLANMSHELRTPLNSLLILSKLLADNKDQNLTSKQIEYANIIYSSGNDLLALINDILDLAKIESGKVQVSVNKVMVSELLEHIDRSLRPVAIQKNLEFQISVGDDVPTYLHSDEGRILQVLKNLLSNAIKFTNHGKVKLEVTSQLHSNGHQGLAFAVVDTGIGISKENQEIIFEAFQQADGTTSRKFGGTGLGLSISKELAQLLGGEITVESYEGIGSTFTFYVSNFSLPKANKEVAVTLENQDFITKNTEIKNNRIGIDEDTTQSENDIKRLLIVEDDNIHRNSLMELIGNMDFIIKGVSTGHEAFEELKVQNFDCMILDLGLKDTNGFELLESIKDQEKHGMKIFVYTGRDLSPKEEFQLSKYAHTIIIKNEHAPERLISELQLFLNENCPTNHQEEGNRGVEEFNYSDLQGKKILLADDDVRNVFAISSILESVGLEVEFAENGFEAIEVLQSHLDIDLVLMDIMMPEMDGYEAIKRIREMPRYRDLPIIGVTAKAMKEDREKCLAVGASDYLVKPVETDQLLSLIQVWLYQKKGVR